MKRVERDDEGSIVLTILVALVASGLAISLVVLTDAGLKQSRNSGEAANALQLADAGVNAAVRAITNLPTTDPGPISGTSSLGGAQDRYEYTATKEIVDDIPIWRVTATGVDSAGSRRRIRADAVPTPLFSSALFVQTNLGMGNGGSVDSFINGASRANMCTKKGRIGTNAANLMATGNMGGGAGVINCQQATYGSSYPYSYDGCISYADSNPPDFPVSAKCPPPPLTQKKTPAEPLTVVESPAGMSAVPQPGGECGASTAPISPGTYYWTSVTLRNGCTMGTGGDVTIFTTGQVDIGRANGNGGDVNRPPVDPAVCPNSDGSINDAFNDNGSAYCPGWAGRLRINVVQGSSPNVILRNHVKFWGVITAPNSTLLAGATGGAPHVTVWGAIIAQSANLGAQFTMHYDEALNKLRTTTFRIKNWREEAPGV